MMQGDSYGISIEIETESGTIVTDADVSDVQITIGFLTKTMSGGDVTFKDGVFIFPITEEESFALIPKPVKAQVRVKWTNGDIEGVSLGDIRVTESMSRMVFAK